MASEFRPSIWMEEAVPVEVEGCTKCALCAQRSRMIWGEGNPKAPVIAVLDNPGAREDREGRPMICPTRQTLQEGAYRAGLKPEDIYVTYILKCRPVRKYDKEAARGACLGYLLLQLERQKPRLGFCLGDTAAMWFFGDSDARVKNLRGSWHIARGLPTAVTYHPLAVRRRPTLTGIFDKDWSMLAEKLHKG